MGGASHRGATQITGMSISSYEANSVNILLGCENGEVVLMNWDHKEKKGKKISAQKAMNGSVERVCYGPEYCATGDTTGSIRIYEAGSSMRLRFDMNNVCDGAITSLKAFGNNHFVVTEHALKPKIKVIDARTGQVVRVLQGHKAPIMNAQIVTPA